MVMEVLRYGTETGPGGRYGGKERRMVMEVRRYSTETGHRGVYTGARRD